MGAAGIFEILKAKLSNSDTEERKREIPILVPEWRYNRLQEATYAPCPPSPRFR